MTNERLANVPGITRFVRDVLGCNCPDEVFRQVELRRGSAAIKSCSADWEIHIGGRLLIVVTSEPLARLDVPRLEKVFAEGQTARDAGKFNRFRLVVRVEDAARGKEKLLRAFEKVSTRDEKTHLHVIEKGEAPDFCLAG